MSDKPTINDKPTKPSNKRGDALPTDGFGLEVDRKMKSLYATSEAALKAGLEIKRKFPLVQVTVFDAVERTRMPVELPKESAA
ncbi:MAG TPA: hypothetical protein VET25_03185 [Aestuariivirgaceae bacterium]|nr:hypothetical protein [Aestuariivirgaceae bacterium]